MVFRAALIVCDASEVGPNPRPDDLVTGFLEKSFANQGLRLGVHVVLDINRESPNLLP